MTFRSLDMGLHRAAGVLVRDHFCVGSTDEVVITADTATDPIAVEALLLATREAGAQAVVLLFPQLPFQGALADPYIPETVKLAVRNCDVWFDLTFPYMAGSHTHDEAMQAKRARYVLVGDLGAAGLSRLYGGVDFDRLFEVQSAIDQFFIEAEGAEGRVTCPKGTDLHFILGKPATRKFRHANMPGTQTVPGSAIMFPLTESVRGRVVLDAVFHEYYTRLGLPLTLEVDGKIRSLDGGAADVAVMDRALRRAGGGGYGYVIHLSYGFHPAARPTGRAFIEDIRVLGSNAIGLGLPWWVPGGGENHPDGVVSNQSMWIGGTPVVENGLLCHPPAAVELLSTLTPLVR